MKLLIILSQLLKLDQESWWSHYQVPVEVKKKAQTLAIRWLVESARKRKDKHMSDKIFNELFDARKKRCCC